MCGVMDNLLIQARKASRDSGGCRRTIDTLRGMGFGDDAFNRLFPSQDEIDKIFLKKDDHWDWEKHEYIHNVEEIDYRTLNTLTGWRSMRPWRCTTSASWY